MPGDLNVDVLAEVLNKHDDVAFCQHFGKDYDFRKTDEDGVGILHHSISALIDPDLNASDREKMLNILRFMLQNGADPLSVVPDDADESYVPDDANEPWAAITLFRENVEHIWSDDVDDFEAEVSYLGKNSIDIVQKFRGKFIKFHYQPENDWADIIRHANVVLKMMIQHTTCPSDCFKVHDSCVDMWDRLRQDEDSTDVTLTDTNGNQIASAHSAILSASSPVLKAMLMGPFIESKTKQICIGDGLDPGSIHFFLDCLYCGSASHNPSLNYKAVLDALHLSHRWEIAHVSVVCRKILSNMLNAENAEAIAEVADKKWRLYCTIPIENRSDFKFSIENVFELGCHSI